MLISATSVMANEFACKVTSSPDPVYTHDHADITYTCQNESAYPIADVKVEASTPIDNGSLVQDTTDCEGSLAAGASCEWKGQFTPDNDAAGKSASMAIQYSYNGYQPVLTSPLVIPIQDGTKLGHLAFYENGKQISSLNLRLDTAHSGEIEVKNIGDGYISNFVLTIPEELKSAIVTNCQDSDQLAPNARCQFSYTIPANAFSESTHQITASGQYAEKTAVLSLNIGYGKFIATSSNALRGEITTSLNGEDWTRFSIVPHIGSLAQNNGHIIAFSLTSSDKAYVSDDVGGSWQSVELPGRYKINRVRYISKRYAFFVVGDNGIILVSFNDGQSWHQLAAGVGSDINLQDIAYANDQFLAIGNQIGTLELSTLASYRDEDWQSIPFGIPLPVEALGKNNKL